MIREKLYWQDSVFRLDSLTVYRAILQDEVIRALRGLCQTLGYDAGMTDISAKYYDFFSKLLVKTSELHLTGNVLRKYFIHLFLNDENAFTLACERNENVAQTSLYQYAAKDINALQYFCDFDIKNLCDNVGYGEDLLNVKQSVSTDDPYLEEVENTKTMQDKMNALLWHYQRMGVGEMASCAMFRMDTQKEALLGVRDADPVVLTDIIGFEWQKEMLVSNTEAFLSGASANNVLLVGSRGNGKSSCVKALANQFFYQGLRLIEINRDQTHLLPGLLNALSKRGKYYIIFMDDLSFEDFETHYKYLKSVLEGGVAVRPKNILFYATSNRRHIIRENWGDRSETPPDEEVHTTDTVNEKLSLSDRFGVTITFPNISQDEYIQIVQGLAKRKHLTLDADFLAKQAVQWALTQKSMSGRTAQQFINHIMWELQKSL